MPRPSLLASRASLLCATLLVGAAPALALDLEDAKPVRVSTYFEKPLLGLDVSSSNEEKGKSHDLRPNTAMNLGVAFDWGAFAIAASAPVTRQTDVEKEGRTRYYDFQTAYVRGIWAVEAGAHDYRGFSEKMESEDPADAAANGDVDYTNPAKDESERRILPNLGKSGYFLTGLLMPFDADLHYDESLLQKGSTGFHWSPAFEASYEHSRFKGLSEVVQTDVDRAEVDSTSLDAGAAVKYRTTRWLFKGNFLFGGNVQWQSVHAVANPTTATASHDDHDRRLGYHTSMRAGVERSFGESWSASVALSTFTTTYEIADVDIDSTLGLLTLGANYRL
jgi:hypothetical protein